MNDSRRGVLLGFAAAVSFGVSAPLAKQLLDEMPPQLLAGVLYLGACVALLVARALRGRTAAESQLHRTDVPALAGLVVSGGVIAPVLLLFGLQRLSGAQGSLLLNLEGPVTLGLALVIFREHLDRRALAAAGAIFGGAALLSWADPSGVRDVLGVVLIAGACAMWALDNNLTQRLTVRDPYSIVIVKTGVAGLVNTLLAVALGVTRPSSVFVALALCLGAVSYGVSVLLDAYALRLLGAAKEAAIFGTAPFIGAAVAVLFFNDRLSSVEVSGAIAMAVGVALLLRERHRHAHRHLPLEHEHAHVHDVHHQHHHAAGTVATEPHAHPHRHTELVHAHEHSSDAHHRHGHD